jgi:hypothetical protein
MVANQLGSPPLLLFRFYFMPQWLLFLPFPYKFDTDMTK